MQLTTLFLRIGLRVVLLFGTAMLMTFVNDWLAGTGFFGDRPMRVFEGCLNCDGVHWGARHYWYFWMCVLLFLLGLVAGIAHVVKDVARYEQQQKKG